MYLYHGVYCIEANGAVANKSLSDLTLYVSFVLSFTLLVVHSIKNVQDQCTIHDKPTQHSHIFNVNCACISNTLSLFPAVVLGCSKKSS